MVGLPYCSADEEEHEQDVDNRPGGGEESGSDAGTRAMAMTTASMHQAVTSLTAAQVMAIAPTWVLWRFRSVRILARTGKAVTLMAAPMNRATDVIRTAGRLLKKRGIEIHRRHGSGQKGGDYAGTADNDGGMAAVAEELGVQFKTDEEEEEDHADLAEGVEVLNALFGENAFEGGGEEPAEEAWAQHDAGDHFAHDLGLSEADEEQAHDPAEARIRAIWTTSKRMKSEAGIRWRRRRAPDGPKTD